MLLFGEEDKGVRLLDELNIGVGVHKKSTVLPSLTRMPLTITLLKESRNPVKKKKNAAILTRSTNKSGKAFGAMAFFAHPQIASSTSMYASIVKNKIKEIFIIQILL
jgi:hypothetical protein